MNIAGVRICLCTCGGGGGGLSDGRKKSFYRKTAGLKCSGSMRREKKKKMYRNVTKNNFGEINRPKKEPVAPFVLFVSWFLLGGVCLNENWLCLISQ